MIEKIIINIIKLLATIFVFFLITGPIVDFIVKDGTNTFGLSWAISMVLGMFYIELSDIVYELKKMNKDDE